MEENLGAVSESKLAIAKLLCIIIVFVGDDNDLDHFSANWPKLVNDTLRGRGIFNDDCEVLGDLKPTVAVEFA